jgi:hypothetical protein
LVKIIVIFKGENMRDDAEEAGIDEKMLATFDKLAGK